MIVATLLAALSLSPEQAAHAAARIVGHPEIGGALVRICQRESRCQRIGIHSGDAGNSKLVCPNAVRVGWLAPDVDCSAGGYSTRGSWGLMAAYNLKWVGLDRWPWVLDYPIVSAVAAARKYLSLCVVGRTAQWCPRRRS